MDQTILHTLFFGNLEIPAEIAKFCNTIPECVQAEQEYNRAAAKLLDLIGYECYNEFEFALTSHLSCEVRAYCLFGPGLRQEVLKGLGVQCRTEKPPFAKGGGTAESGDGGFSPIENASIFM